MRRYVLLTFLLLAACRQEISSDANAPALTLPPTLEAVPTVAVSTEAVLEIPSTPTSLPATPTLVSFPSAQAFPAGPIGIIAMGDSLTLGDGDESGRGYPGRLLEKVTQLRPESSLSNFGQSGWNSDALINGDQGLFGQLPLAIDETKLILSRGRGALVLLWIGSNDLWYLYEYGGDVTSAQELQDAEVGEPRALSMEMTEATAPVLPVNKPRYVMGVGAPEELPEYVARGIDMMDCVMPSRNARNGCLFTSEGKVIIKHARYKDDGSPLDGACSCSTCKKYSKAYLRHLFLAGEISYCTLATIHNLRRYLDIMRQIRQAILLGAFPEFLRSVQMQAVPAG